MDVLFGDQVDGLVLSDLHAGAHIALPMKKECEGTRQVFAGGGERQTRNRFISTLMNS